MLGPVVGALVGWFLSTQFRDTSRRATTAQQQIDQIYEIDRCVASALASLRAYEKRVLAGKHLGETGDASTKPPSPSSPNASLNGTPPSGQPPKHAPLREPLDGHTLLDIKRETDQTLRACTHALTRATAVLDDETMGRAEALVDALLALRETLEEQETCDEASPDAMQAQVSTLHRSRTQLLRAARAHLGVTPLSADVEERVETLAEQTFAPSRLPRPYVTTGVRLAGKRS